MTLFFATSKLFGGFTFPYHPCIVYLHLHLVVFNGKKLVNVTVNIPVPWMLWDWFLQCSCELTGHVFCRNIEIDQLFKVEKTRSFRRILKFQPATLRENPAIGSM